MQKLKRKAGVNVKMFYMLLYIFCHEASVSICHYCTCPNFAAESDQRFKAIAVYIQKLALSYCCLSCSSLSVTYVVCTHTVSRHCTGCQLRMLLFRTESARKVIKARAVLVFFYKHSSNHSFV